MERLTYSSSQQDVTQEKWRDEVLRPAWRATIALISGRVKHGRVLDRCLRDEIRNSKVVK